MARRMTTECREGQSVRGCFRRSLALVVSVMALFMSSERCSAEVRSVSRVYHSACLERGQTYWDYENFQLSSVKLDDVDRYEITGRLGFGRFSEVLEGLAHDDGHKVVLKVLKPARSYKIKREIRVLQLLAGGPNVLRLEGVCRDRDTGSTTLVLEHLGEGAQWFGHTAGGGGSVGAALPTGVPPSAAEASPRGKNQLFPLGGVLTGKGSAAAGAAALSIGRGSTLWSSITAEHHPSLASTNRLNLDRKVEEGRLEHSPWVAKIQQPNALKERQACCRDEGVRVEGDISVGGDGGREVFTGEGRERRGQQEQQGQQQLELGRLSDYEVRLFLYKLLQALDFAHSRGIMHRDVKPRNVVINRRTRSLRLIDWGLGDFYIPGRRNMARVGSRYYKAPELLLGFRFYDYAVDIFSVGCMLAGFLLNREPFFRGKDNEDQLLRIALVLGTQGIFDFLRKYDVALEPRLVEMLGMHRKKAWGSVGASAGVTNIKGEVARSPEGLDLLDRMLCYDHQDRISAREALSHAFFDPVRSEAEEATRR